MELDLQIACDGDNLPSHDEFYTWAHTVLTAVKHKAGASLTIRLVDNDEMQQLNHDYRGKDKVTNVLSFPFEPYEALMAYAGDAAELNILGDIIIAPAVIATEASEQGKALKHHYAHMTIHGVLHLLGYDHIEDAEAEAMEALEIDLLARLGIPNPYL